MEGTQRVLVVDDDPEVVLLCRSTLAFEGYEVLQATTGHEAMRLARDEDLDAILLDATLPHTDGREILDALGDDAALADVPVVVLTADGQHQDRIPGWSPGVVEYMTKPFSPGALSDVVADVVTTGPAEEDDRRRAILDRLGLSEGG